MLLKYCLMIYGIIVLIYVILGLVYGIIQSCIRKYKEDRLRTNEYVLLQSNPNNVNYEMSYSSGWSDATGDSKLLKKHLLDMGWQSSLI